MGKGKGAVDYFATWISPGILFIKMKGRVLFEIKNTRNELAERGKIFFNS